MTPLEVFRVAAWKTGQGLGELTRNGEADFVRLTAAAMDEIRPWRGTSILNVDDDATWDRWRETASVAAGVNGQSGLMRLYGVSYPMASSILCILDPKVWPVIDKWAIRTVFGTRSDGEPLQSSLWQRSVIYAAYARRLATEGPRFWSQAETVHDLDQAAMRASMPARRKAPPGTVPAGWTVIPLPT
jgi:hypothetical protein